MSNEIKVKHVTSLFSKFNSPEAAKYQVPDPKPNNQPLSLFPKPVYSVSMFDKLAANVASSHSNLSAAARNHMNNMPTSEVGGSMTELALLVSHMDASTIPRKGGLLGLFDRKIAEIINDFKTRFDLIDKSLPVVNQGLTRLASRYVMVSTACGSHSLEIINSVERNNVVLNDINEFIKQLEEQISNFGQVTNIRERSELNTLNSDLKAMQSHAETVRNQIQLLENMVQNMDQLAANTKALASALRLMASTIDELRHSFFMRKHNLQVIETSGAMTKAKALITKQHLDGSTTTQDATAAVNELLTNNSSETEMLALMSKQLSETAQMNEATNRLLTSRHATNQQQFSNRF